MMSGCHGGFRAVGRLELAMDGFDQTDHRCTVLANACQLRGYNRQSSVPSLFFFSLVSSFRPLYSTPAFASNCCPQRVFLYRSFILYHVLPSISPFFNSYQKRHLNPAAPTFVKSVRILVCPFLVLTHCTLTRPTQRQRESPSRRAFPSRFQVEC